MLTFAVVPPVLPVPGQHGEGGAEGVHRQAAERDPLHPVTGIRLPSQLGGGLQVRGHDIT